ncbi:MAG: DUF4292 domain-containing protein [Bacteroidales bacterium]|nr:DUF4292 domain-containing protein [Bacteroidales bacterium]
MKHYKVLVLLAVLLMVGCHSSRKAARTAVADTVPAEPEVAVEAPQRQYIVVNFEGEVEGFNVVGQLRLAEDSAMWVSVNKVIEVGRAMATPDSLWMRSSLLGRNDALDYATLRRQTGVDITFDEMQQTILADDADARLDALAHRLGVKATLRITGRRRVERLSFPYPKPIKR